MSPISRTGDDGVATYSMNESFPKAPSLEVMKTEPRHSYVRNFVIGGLGSALVATSALYKDDTGETFLQKGIDEIASKNVDARVAKLSSDERVVYDAVSNTLYAKVRARVVGSMVNREQLANELEQGESVKTTPRVEGFELTGIISNEDVQKATGENFFPNGWVTERIHSIAYKPQVVVREGMTIKAQNLQRLEKDDIEFYILGLYDASRQEAERVKYRTISMLLHTLRHEVCHSNDWLTTQQRTFVERVSLLGDIIERVESDDSYNGHLVMNDKEETKKYHLLFGYGSKSERNVAYQEYFADICGGYLENPVEFKEKYPKDYEIVHSWIQKADPGFETRVMPAGPYSPMTGEVLPEWKNIFG
jgi:hypothetical protein